MSAMSASLRQAQQQWQRELDEMFPDGVNVTRYEDVPEEDTAFHVLIPRAMVLAQTVENGGLAMLLQPYDDWDGHHWIIEVEEWDVLETEPVLKVRVRAKNDDFTFLLTNYIGEASKQALALQRRTSIDYQEERYA